MGSCVSVHKDRKSAMNLRLSFGSKTDKLVIPSPIKEKPLVNGDRTIADVALNSHWSPPRSVTNFRDYGSKEDTFFDSQPWLESDCEDDFLSVNGDFTPSRGSTPVHNGFTIGTPQVNRGHFEDRTSGSKPDLSPIDKKKKLSELFNESLQGDEDVDEQNISNNQRGENGNIEAKASGTDLPSKSANETPYISGANSVYSSERTHSGEFKHEEKSVRSSVQCCLPRLRSSRSFSERKKKMSPARSIG